MGGIDWTESVSHCHLTPSCRPLLLMITYSALFGDLPLPQGLVEFRLSPSERPRTKADATL
jgi:hypothetical protein